MKAKRADFLSPEARRELGRRGGLANAARNFATAEQRKEKGAQIHRAKQVHGLLRQVEFVQKLQDAERVKLGKPAPIRPEPMLDLERIVRLPRSSSRREPNVFIKLLRKVDEGLEHSGFGWHGVYLKPGSVVPESALAPTGEFPPLAILLECAGRVGEDGEVSFVLWRRQQSEWIQVAEARSKDWSWSIDLRKIAVRLLRDQGFPLERRIDRAQLARASSRLSALIDAELSGLDPDIRESVLAIVHDALASRLAAAGNGGRHSITAAVLDVRPEREF